MSKDTFKVYDDIYDKYVEVNPVYGVDDGLVTIFGISKDIKNEIENYTFLVEILKLITKKSFIEKPKIEQIDNL
ncbi:hypothetical protein AN960_20920 [Bacillus sp. FJAT-25509]|uniref:hypothetical protein n=1 Tax=Bacillus sp. FJAT-25509 TaxID=1712029 RepID=UPI0006FD9D96|nr:hypothetical protein [Bacillus sp. FJAT-25509]KQL33538.1 hypothetical protein AN960_20920 [Bacillus sp. FJAT-25509]